MASAEEFLAHIQAHGPTVRRGFTRDGRPVQGFGIWLDDSTYIQNGYVWPQQAPPYNYVVPVHHCGLTLGVFAHELQMTRGADWFDSAWTPAGADGFRAAGRWHTRPERGDWAYFNYGSGIIRHVGAVLDGTEFDAGFVTCFEFNTDATGQGIIRRRPTWMIVGYGRPLYAPPKPDPTPVVATITTLQQLQAQEDSMPLIIDLTDATGAIVGHRAYAPGMGWIEPDTDQLTEENGWQRAQCPADTWESWSMQSLANTATMTDLTARRVLAIMAEQ